MDKLPYQPGYAVTRTKAWSGYKRTSTGFVGNYIHKPSTGGWYNHYKRQRPSKVTKQYRKGNKMEDKSISPPTETQEQKGPTHTQSSESGYDTTGDLQTPKMNGRNEKEMNQTRPLKEVGSPSDSSVSSEENSSKMEKGNSSKEGQNVAEQLSDSSGSKSRSLVNVNVESSALRNLLKDLNRCDVSIRRYQNSLEHVSNAIY